MSLLLRMSLLIRSPTISRLLRIIGLFCRISSLLQGSVAKESIILRRLLIVVTPYVLIYMYVPLLFGINIVFSKTVQIEYVQIHI